MKGLDKISDGISDGILDIKSVICAINKGIKQKYGFSGLSFIHNNYLSFQYAFSDILDGYSLYDTVLWKCTVKQIDENVEPHALNLLFETLCVGRGNVYFNETGKIYKHIDDLKKDFLVLNLSCI